MWRSGPTRPARSSAPWSHSTPGSSTGPKPQAWGAVAESSRREWPLFCAVTKAGRLTGAALSDKAVARLVKGAAARAGLATAAADAGAALPDLMRQTRNKSTQVALAYLRPADLWHTHVTERVFAAKKENEG